MIVNCGGFAVPIRLVRVARASAAHSLLVIETPTRIEIDEEGALGRCPQVRCERPRMVAINGFGDA